jgi:outer membrane protein assembly factor BamB
MPSFEDTRITIKDFHDRHSAKEMVNLVKKSSWHRTGTGPMESPPRLVGERLYAPARDGHLRILDAGNGELLADHDTGLLGGFEARPLLVDGLVYLASLDRKLLAVKPDSGKLAWSFDTKAALRAAPVACAGLIIVADEDGTAYGVRDGKQVWKVELDGRVQGDPIPLGDSVFFGTTEAVVYRLDGRTGDVLWKVDAEGRVYASLALVGEDRLIVGTDSPSLVSLSPKDGSRQWSFPADNAIRGTPVESDGRIFFTTLSGTLYAVGTEDGRQVALFRASAEPAPFESCPAIGEKGVYVVDSDGLLLCYTMADGMRWSFSLGGRAVAAPVVAGGFLFVATESGDIFCFRE